MHRYILIVANVGHVWSGNNPVEAQKQYSEWIAEAKRETGRASGEVVTLVRQYEGSDEVLRTFDPHAGFYFVEVTDTYGGESNYSWVRRYKVKAFTMRGAMGKVPGYAWRKAYGDSEGMRYNARGACVCAFVSHWDRDIHSYSNIETL